MTWQSCAELSAIAWLFLVLLMFTAVALSYGAIIIYRSVNWAVVRAWVRGGFRR